MKPQLSVSVGQYSDKGRKPSNQDFYGTYIPEEPLLTTKGIAVAIADGISSSTVSQVAAESAVTAFLSDYYCTSETWSVKTAARRVIAATNSWLFAQTQQSPYRYDKDRGYVCAFSAMVLKSNNAHIFHAGDTRVYQLHGDNLEQLTRDHRLQISEEQSYLNRALGVNQQLEIDYHNIQIHPGDSFLLATDGIYEHVSSQVITDTIRKFTHDLDQAAKALVEAAFGNGSGDNLTAQIIRVEQLPQQQTWDTSVALSELPLPPLLQPRSSFDGYKIIRQLHATYRSHVYLAEDEESTDTVVLKIPSVDQSGDLNYIERFLLEEWIARRINSAHVLKPCKTTRRKNFQYVAMEYIEGQTLSQWLCDNPEPGLEKVRAIVEQIGRGLQAFHRLEMLHQDLRPDNIMIDQTGTVKIIDFGAARVAGIAETETPNNATIILGTEQFTAPEYFLGQGGTPCSDLFSLGVIAYQMLSGQLPYGAKVSRCRTLAAQKKLHYRSLLREDSDIPLWVDDTIKKAVHPVPNKRYQELSEFLYDLRHPNKDYVNKAHPPLMERNPVAFWQGVAALLFIIVLFQFFSR